MWYKIKQGRHRAYPLSLGIHTGKTSESYEVIFDESCRYVLDEENQADWNKLVGWSYGFHHQNSIRVGWRYGKDSDLIWLCLYIYENGIRKVIDDSIMVIDFNVKVKIDLELNDSGEVTLLVKQPEGDRILKYTESVFTNMIPKWGYNLGVYFGGNNVTPHDMKVWIKKLKRS